MNGMYVKMEGDNHKLFEVIVMIFYLTKRNHENLYSQYRVIWPRYELGTS